MTNEGVDVRHTVRHKGAWLKLHPNALPTIALVALLTLIGWQMAIAKF